MKRIFLLGLWTAILSTGMCQETLFNRHGIRVGGFGAPIIEFSDLNGNFGVSVGGGGGIMINHFFIGGYALGSTHDILADIDADQFNTTLAHGGLWLGYDFFPYRLVHLTSSFRAGFGVLLFGLEDDFSRYDFEDEVYTLTPELGVELNVSRHVKIGANLGYRWVKDVDTSPYRRTDFDSYTASLVIKFGSFNNRYAYRNSRRN